MISLKPTFESPSEVILKKIDKDSKSDDSNNPHPVASCDLFHKNVPSWLPNVPVPRSPVSAKYSMDVYEISSESDIQYTHSLIMNWSEKADKLRGRFSEKCEVYETAMNVSVLFICSLSECFKSHKYKLWGAFDCRHRLRSVMLMSDRYGHCCYKKYLEISLLLSKPKAPDKHVRGAGAVLVDHAERESVRCGFNGIVLMPVQSAVGFYSHLGLKRMDNDVYMFKNNQFGNSIFESSSVHIDQQ